jgi:replication fork clamp-binding protein CrfC
MADSTLKDVLDALARLEKGQGTLQVDLERFDAKVDGLRREMNTRFDEVDKTLASLDADLDKHMKVHRRIEEDITALKRRPARTAARPTRRR